MNKTERSPTSQRPSVLFVDDEPHVIRSLMRCLRASLANWDVHVAPGGREALPMVETTNFNLIICDLNMPQVDGLTVLQHAAVQCPDALRVLLTGSLPMDHGQHTPVQIHLDKPTTPERLRDVLRMAAQ
jgi:CheY-like chemotaxis protein